MGQTPTCLTKCAECDGDSQAAVFSSRRDESIVLPQYSSLSKPNKPPVLGDRGGIDSVAGRMGVLVEITPSDGLQLGMVLSMDLEGARLRIDEISADGLVQTWNDNQRGSTMRVCPGDVIVAVNDIVGDSKKMLAQIASRREHEILRLKVESVMKRSVF
mmetsp:Transcript_87434/g.136852  ORF Transcript_87434/g.136852 Transcript_87434/m.136852 type:complete len:159 (-) Transcript_87434:20-496(-)